MSLKGQSIIEAQQFSDPQVLQDLLDQASRYDEMIRAGNRYGDQCLKGKRVVIFFYEASTRTSGSFDAAALNLGAECRIHVGAVSSAVKGESLEHSVRMFSSQCDLIILRHSDDDAAERARNYLESLGIHTPVINAGCGRGQHPSQALLDRYTIPKELGRTDNLHIVIAGDLARGRTARSLAYMAGRLPGVTIGFYSPLQLAMGTDILGYLERHGVTYYQRFEGIEEALPVADVIYMTRVQKERPLSGVDLSTIDEASFRMTVGRAQRMKKGSILMHPLPIVDEIEPGVERLPHAAFFRQSDNGIPVRMALLKTVLCGA